MGENIISTIGVSKSYGSKEVFKDISLNFERGVITGIVGKNGIGKSTLLNCILGIEPIDSGKILFNGVDIYDSGREKYQDIGIQFQSSNFQNKIKVKELCREFTALYDNPADWNELLTIFDLLKHQNQYVKDLSGGERQRLSTVIAMIGSPSLVLLDEPTAGLDIYFRREFLKYISNLKKEKKISVLLVSHYYEEILLIVDNVVIINDSLDVAMHNLQGIDLEMKGLLLKELYFKDEFF